VRQLLPGPYHFGRIVRAEFVAVNDFSGIIALIVMFLLESTLFPELPDRLTRRLVSLARCRDWFALGAFS
jgi:hypothetical protein